MLRSRFGVGNFVKVGNVWKIGVGHLTSDSATLLIAIISNRSYVVKSFNAVKLKQM